MRKFFNKILSSMLVFSVFISSFSLNIISVHADGEHKFLIKAYDGMLLIMTGKDLEQVMSL